MVFSDPTLSKTLALEAAERACVLGDIESFPNDWETLVGEKGIISTNINDSDPLTPKLFLNDGTTEFGPESENFESEYGHQRKWVDACKSGFNSKERGSRINKKAK